MGRSAPLAVESRDVEGWFRELARERSEEGETVTDPTIDKSAHHEPGLQARAAMQFPPRQQEGNPMNWVSQRTTSDYRAIVMTPKQAFEVLLNTPEPRRTLTLSDRPLLCAYQNCWA